MTAFIRNIGIIATIDHGKTTLLDALLKQSNIFRANEKVAERVMDSYDQERERAITIFAKQTGIYYKGYKINIVDTPGHSDFSGEVERALGMVNSVLLIIDAQDGPMPQTRFGLSKALKMGLCPIVVINKIDRPHADPYRALDQTFDLFVELGARDDQLDFKYCFASALEGYAIAHLDDPRENINPLLDLILSAAPPPQGNPAAPFLMQVMSIDYDPYVGRRATGRILNGKISKGERVMWINEKGEKRIASITRILGYQGLDKIEMAEAMAGEIVNLSGIPEVMLGDTLCDCEHEVHLPPLKIDQPTLSIEIRINSGPFAGRDGKNVTFNKIKERLLKEKESNISLKIEESLGEEEGMRVYGRGELQLGVLLEAMRREGIEMTVSRPQVVLKEIEGKSCEPIERVYMDLPEEFAGVVIEELSKRRGELQVLHRLENNMAYLEFLIPTRGIMGYRSDFLSVTRGLGIMTALFESFQPWKGEIAARSKGALVSNSCGRATAYAIGAIQKRGILFVGPGDEVYEGMIVGENSREQDLVVNVTRAKQLTNVRASGADENILITPAQKLSLEEAIVYIAEDELIEITPRFIRLRKKKLKERRAKMG